MIRKSNVYRMLPLILAAITPSLEAAQLVYQNTFEKGMGGIRFKGTPMTPAGCEDEKFKLVPDPENSGNQVIRILQRGDNTCLADQGRHRAQFNLENPLDGKLGFYEDHTHYFIGYRMYIPADFPASWMSPNNADIIHAGQTRSCSGDTPRGTFNAKGSQLNLVLEQRWGEANCADISQTKVELPLKMGGWNTIIHHIKWEWDNSGVWETWINGVRVVNKTGIRTASDPAVIPGKHSQSFGLYWGKENRPVDFQIYFDDIRIAQGSDGFDLVNTNIGDISPLSAPSNLQLQMLPINN